MLQHLLILTSSTPDFLHSRAGRTVCALLTEELGRQIDKVTVGLCCADGPASEETVVRLAEAGVDVVNFPARRAVAPAETSPLTAALALVQSLALNDARHDYPHLDDARALAAEIDAIGADATLLFWDTLAEFALPYLKTPCFGYLARPPFESGVSRTKMLPSGARRSLTLAQFAAQERRHLQRMRLLSGAANICAIDAAYYDSRGIPCDYVSNTWDDSTGPEWLSRRTRLEAGMTEIQILGNIGAVSATGNTFGMNYLGREVLPILAAVAPDSGWSIGICGGGKMAPHVADALNHPRVRINGFVDDIDAEMLSSGIFLVLNNAGPYTGGYTRVIYSCATGGALVAHANLKNSMPEMISGKNCLLGETPQDIARHIARLLTDPALRWQLGAAARKTYETDYAPGQVATKLVEMVGKGLHGGSAAA